VDARERLSSRRSRIRGSSENRDLGILSAAVKGVVGSRASATDGPARVVEGGVRSTAVWVSGAEF
jgi:hypothetical protein